MQKNTMIFSFYVAVATDNISPADFDIRFLASKFKVEVQVQAFVDHTYGLSPLTSQL